jgi:hypothetical protein
MRRTRSNPWLGRRLVVIVLALALAALPRVGPGIDNATAATKQTAFATPEQAVDALTAAVRIGSTAELVRILGPGSRDLVSSGDRVADEQARTKFLAAYEDSNRLETRDDGQVVLVVGHDDWHFPFPLVKEGDAWHFDEGAGAEEIIDRRIGGNELAAIEVCLAYVDAQRDYATEDRNHDGYVEYAQKFVSSPGQHDGLYWPVPDGEEESPIGPLMARAYAEGYVTGDVQRPQTRKPYHGYLYRILKGQGPAAEGGAYDYVIRNHMMGGFALVAFPAQYDVSGVMTFIVNHDGIVYQKDLGPRTAEIARAMKVYNPDEGWTTP